MTLLSPGETFPALDVELVGGGKISLPDELHGHFGIVLFYRGSWCPYCNAQLRGFQHAIQSFEKLDARVIALSIDDEQTSAALVAKHGLTFPIGHSADPATITARTGAFVSPAGPAGHVTIQSTGFVLDPAGILVTSVYSSGAIGRLVAEDVIGLIRYMTAHR